jgi:dTDP-4-dehydrorhamnose 3,5-epimerase
MHFTQTPLAGAYVIDLEKRGDDRGYFARAFCAREFAEQGLATHFVQANMSLNRDRDAAGAAFPARPRTGNQACALCHRGALRRHRRYPARQSHPPAKLRRRTHCRKRPGALCAQGFCPWLPDAPPDTTASYMVDEFYTPDAEGGLRYDDPALGLDWPGEVHVISPKDAAWPLLET